jgi:phenylpyruvate tautomerase PptA (4-oxalocrotonate tautomerase family)
MPYLHLDLPHTYPLPMKRDLAKRLGNIYAAVMQTTPDLVNVTFRELGAGNVWKCGVDEPRPAVVVSCEIRRGRPPEQRERLGRSLLAAIAQTLEFDPTLIAVEMTQHAGDEIYLEAYVDGVLQGGLGKDWSPTETERSMMETLIAERFPTSG